MDTTITNLEILPLGESKYLKPFKMKFKQNGLQRDWDCVKVMNSVSIFLYHEQKDAFLFVKQFFIFLEIYIFLLYKKKNSLA